MVQTVLAFDFGESRIGIAVGNSMLREATPLAVLATLPREMRFTRISELITAWQPDVLVVGVARNVSGEDSPMTARCIRFANQLEGRFHLPVVKIDERYSSLEAEMTRRDRRAAGYARAGATLDDLAAAIILKRFFDEHPATLA
jgi:putative Holliday junction resolvase